MMAYDSMPLVFGQGRRVPLVVGLAGAQNLVDELQ